MASIISSTSSIALRLGVQQVLGRFLGHREKVEPRSRDHGVGLGVVLGPDQTLHDREPSNDRRQTQSAGIRDGLQQTLTLLKQRGQDAVYVAKLFGPRQGLLFSRGQFAPRMLPDQPAFQLGPTVLETFYLSVDR